MFLPGQRGCPLACCAAVAGRRECAELEVTAQGRDRIKPCGFSSVPGRGVGCPPVPELQDPGQLRCSAGVAWGCWAPVLSLAFPACITSLDRADRAVHVLNIFGVEATGISGVPFAER